MCKKCEDEETYPSFLNGAVPILRHGTIHDDDGSSWTHWAVVDRATAEKACAEIDAGIELEAGEDQTPPWNQYYYRRRRLCNPAFAELLTGWCSYETGVGRAFMQSPAIRVYGKKLFISWSGGLDI